MKAEDFKEQINQIEAMYGKTFNDTELKIWFENLKFLSIERFRYIVSEIYKTCKGMPKLADILEKHREIPYKKAEVKDIDVKCKKCNGTGIILYTKEIEGRPYQYACACDCGRAETYDGRSIKDEKNRSEFYMPSAKQLGFEDIANEPSKQEVIASMIKVKDSGYVSESIKEIIRRKLKEGYK